VTDIPTGIYLAHRPLDSAECLPGDTVHICIDKNELAELVLRLTLGLQGILPSQASKLFGYYSNKNNSYYFLNEEQHQYIQSSRQKTETPCEE